MWKSEPWEKSSEFANANCQRVAQFIDFSATPLRFNKRIAIEFEEKPLLLSHCRLFSQQMIYLFGVAFTSRNRNFSTWGRSVAQLFPISKVLTDLVIVSDARKQRWEKEREGWGWNAPAWDPRMGLKVSHDPKRNGLISRVKGAGNEATVQERWFKSLITKMRSSVSCHISPSDVNPFVASKRERVFP